MSDAREGAGFFFSEKPVPVEFHRHAVRRYLQIPVYLGWQPKDLEGHIPVSRKDRTRIHDLLNKRGESNGILLAINPLAKWTTKQWEPERFAALAERLMGELGCEIVFTGSSNDRAPIEDMIKPMRRKPINLAGMTRLKELAYLYTRCAALITTDTGPMHIAAAVKCPVIALFGPTAPCAPVLTVKGMRWFGQRSRAVLASKKNASISHA